MVALKKTKQTESMRDVRQQQAVADCLETYKTSDRLIMQAACGTGKTKVGSMLAKALDASRVLIVVPTTELVAQTLREWAKFSKTDGYKVQVAKTAGLCSRSELGKYNGQTFSSYSKAEEVCDLNVVVTTYASAHKLSAQSFDLVILDEGHRAASNTGRKILQWTEVKHFVLGTATPAKILKSKDMEVFGPVATSYPHLQAVADGTLVPIQAKFIFSNHLRPKEVEDAEDTIEWVKNVLSILTENGKISKTILYCRTTVQVDLLTADLNAMGNPGLARAIHSDLSSLSAVQRAQNMADFRDDKVQVLVNANCLVEGVDIPAVDAVFFMNSTKSQIRVVQACGRAARISSGKAFGSIFMPIYVGFGGVKNLQEDLKNTEFGIAAKHMAELVDSGQINSIDDVIFLNEDGTEASATDVGVFRAGIAREMNEQAEFTDSVKETAICHRANNKEPQQRSKDPYERKLAARAAGWRSPKNDQYVGNNPERLAIMNEFYPEFRMQLHDRFAKLADAFKENATWHRANNREPQPRSKDLYERKLAFRATKWRSPKSDQYMGNNHEILAIMNEFYPEFRMQLHDKFTNAVKEVATWHRANKKEPSTRSKDPYEKKLGDRATGWRSPKNLRYIGNEPERLAIMNELYPEFRMQLRDVLAKFTNAVKEVATWHRANKKEPQEVSKDLYEKKLAVRAAKWRSPKNPRYVGNNPKRMAIMNEFYPEFRWLLKET